jgi:hypothetical protein
LKDRITLFEVKWEISVHPFLMKKTRCKHAITPGSVEKLTGYGQEDIMVPLKTVPQTRSGGVSLNEKLDT